jgi:tRNA A37 threonylcarbamoyladenosine biosynthesis protein TsaE
VRGDEGKGEKLGYRCAASLLFKNGAGAERLAARGQILRGLGGPGEVTSPLFSINSILNANWYETVHSSLFTLHNSLFTEYLVYFIGRLIISDHPETPGAN